MDPLLHSVAAAADRLGLTYAGMATLINSGEIRSLNRGGRRLVPETELVRWVGEQVDNIDIAPTVKAGAPNTFGFGTARYAGSTMAQEVLQKPESIS